MEVRESSLTSSSTPSTTSSCSSIWFRVSRFISMIFSSSSRRSSDSLSKLKLISGCILMSPRPPIIRTPGSSLDLMFSPKLMSSVFLISPGSAPPTVMDRRQSSNMNMVFILLPLGCFERADLLLSGFVSLCICVSMYFFPTLVLFVFQCLIVFVHQVNIIFLFVFDKKNLSFLSIIDQPNQLFQFGFNVVCNFILIDNINKAV